MRELTKTYGELLQDKRVRGEQNRYESFSRQRNTVLNKYRKVYQGYLDLQSGVESAKQFYGDMKETVDSLKKNVDSFVENRRSEGGQLLSAIEQSKGGSADREQARLKDMMERMNVSPTTPSGNSPIAPTVTDQRASNHRPPPLQNLYTTARSPPISPQYLPNGMQPGTPNFQNFQRSTPVNSHFRADSTGSYNPSNYPPVSPPAHQQYFNPPPNQQQQQNQQPSTTMYAQQQQPPQTYGQNIPANWQPPPPPPGPPPSQYQDYSALQASNYPSGPGGYANQARRSGQGQGSSADPWAGLSAWK